MTAPKLRIIEIVSRHVVLSLVKQYATSAAQNGVVFVKAYWTVAGMSVLPIM